MDAEGQRDGHHRRQRLRDDGDGQRDAEDEHLDEGLAAQQPQGDDERHDDQGGFGQRLAHPVEVLLQRRLAGLHRLQHAGDLAEFGVHAGGGHHGQPPAIGGHGAGIDQVLAVAERQFPVGQRGGVLLHRDGLAGERGLLDLQVDRLHQACIRRHDVTRAQQNHIARRQVARRDFHFLAVPEDSCGERGHTPQRLDRALGAVFLHKAQQHRKQHDDGDGDGFDAVPERRPRAPWPRAG